MAGELELMTADAFDAVAAGLTSAEATRTTAESARVSAEQNRVSAESTRVQNEDTRIANDVIRITTVDSIAALRAFSLVGLTNGRRMNTSGYYNRGDGGGNEFYWDAASTATDNGGTIIRPDGVAANQPGRWFAVEMKDVSILQFGARVDGVSDDKAAIQAACDSSAKVVRFPEGDAVILSSWIIRSGKSYIGIPNRSFIRIPTNVVSGSFPANEGGAYNENFSLVYNELTAASFEIDGLSFKLERGASTVRTPIMLANVNGVRIRNSYFYGTSPTNLALNALIDLYACWRNVTIQNCYGYNLTTTTVGGCVWVRNMTSSGGVEANNCLNAKILGNYFEKSCSDEVVAIWGARGVVDGVIYSNNINVITAANLAVGFTISGDVDPDSGVNANAKIRNVSATNNIFDFDEFTAHGVFIGKSASTREMRNIVFANNIVRGKISSASTQALLNVEAQNNPNASGIVTRGNTLFNKGNVPIPSGIQGGLVVEGNTISGAFTDYIAYSNFVIANTILCAGGTAITEPSVAGANNISNAVVGLKFLGGTGTTRKMYDNVITLQNNASSMGIQILSVITGTPLIVADDNLITTANAASYAFQASAGQLIMTNNQHQGVGKLIITSGTAQVLRMRGNRIGASGYDDLHNGRITDNDAERAIPVGSVSWDSSVPSGRLGYQKIAAGFGADKWREVVV